MLEDAGVDTSELRAWLATGLADGGAHSNVTIGEHKLGNGYGHDTGYHYTTRHGDGYAYGCVYAIGNGCMYGYENQRNNGHGCGNTE